MVRNTWLLVAILACGPSAELRRARTARYQTERAVVLAAVGEVMAAHYPGVALTPMPFEASYFISGWWWVDGEQPISPDRLFARDPPVGSFIRMHVAVSAASPFAVDVFAEVERYEHGWVTPMTYSPGSAEKQMRKRPAWVQDRIDDLDVAIDRALRKYAPMR